MITKVQLTHRYKMDKVMGYKGSYKQWLEDKILQIDKEIKIPMSKFIKLFNSTGGN